VIKLNRTFLFFFLLFVNFGAYSHVDLTYPEGGETFYSGDTVTITWLEVQAHETQNWQLYYSPDGGESWQEISLNIAVNLREFDWIVPVEETIMGRIRVVQNNVEIDYEDVSANFNIVNVTGVQENDVNKSIASFSNVPNPFIYSTTLQFHLFKTSFVSLMIFKANGSLVATIIKKEMQEGEYEIQWTPIHSFSGTYYAILSVNNRRSVIKLLKQKF